MGGHVQLEKQVDELFVFFPTRLTMARDQEDAGEKLCFILEAFWIVSVHGLHDDGVDC